MSTVTAKTVREQNVDPCLTRLTRVCVCVCVILFVFLIVPFRCHFQFTSVAMLQVLLRILFSIPNVNTFQSSHAMHLFPHLLPPSRPLISLSSLIFFRLGVRCG
jgi:hypothetical protein